MNFRIFEPESFVRRTLSLEELERLLDAVINDIAELPAGPRRDAQIATRREIEADIRMIRWANAPSLKPPSD